MNAMMQTMQGLGSMRVVALGVVGIILLVTFGFLSLRLTSPVLSPLYGNLSTEDSGLIVTELGSMGVDFEIGGNGSQILVNSGDVLRVRMLLAQKGLPSKGSIVGYEVFDRESSLGTSSFVHNVNLLRALEGELGRTIGSLNTIKSARVHLAIPKRELFQRDRVEPSASVVLTLSDKTRFPKKEATAVKHLVSSAVPGLKTSRVTIIDSSGDILAKASSGGEDESGSIVGGDGVGTEDARAGFEARLKRTVETLLEEAVGFGKVKVQVSAEMSFDRVTSSSEVYDPDGQVARSVQSNTETEKTGAGAGSSAVTVDSNLQDGSSAGGGNSNSVEKVDEVTNFEISKTVTSKVSEVGSVKKLSIAVLVDGRYEEDKENETTTYIPRSDEEIEQLRRLVQSAVGYDEKRGDVIEVVNMQFSREADNIVTAEGAFDWLKRDLDSILKTVVVGIVAILAIMLVIRPLVNRAFEVVPADIEAEEAHAAMAAAGAANADGMMATAGGMDEDINLDIIQSKMESQPTRKINDLIENNPEETLSVIRTWLSNKS